MGGKASWTCSREGLKSYPTPVAEILKCSLSHLDNAKRPPFL